MLITFDNPFNLNVSFLFLQNKENNIASLKSKCNSSLIILQLDDKREDTLFLFLKR